MNKTVPDVLESSDTTRHARPLRYARSVRLERGLNLEVGGRLEEVCVAYETYGQLNSARDNAILVCHAISGDSHVAQHDDADDPGWWDIAVGLGKAIDTARFFVICPNLLGGCRGTTGPGSINPRSGRPYGRDFPTITVADMIAVQRQLLDELQIGKLLAVVGGSLGGHQALAWAARYPERVRGIVALATSPRLTSQALAFDVVGRNAILRDPHFHGGQYYDQKQGPDVGLALARMIGHITYLSPEAMTQKFEADRLQPREVAAEFEKRFSVGSYLGHQGSKFVERFDANSYLTLSMAMDLFDLGNSPGELAAVFKGNPCRWLVASFSSDWLFPPEQSRDIVNALLANSAQVSYCNVQSNCGHDAFLLPDDLESYGAMMGSFLDNLEAKGGASACREHVEPVHEAGAKARPLTPALSPYEGERENGGPPEGKTIHGPNAPAESVEAFPGPGAISKRMASSPRPSPTEEERESGRLLEAGRAHGASARSKDIEALDEGAHRSNSIFRQHRLDYDRIMELIPAGASVLDLGCGSGGLLARLTHQHAGESARTETESAWSTGGEAPVSTATELPTKFSTKFSTKFEGAAVAACAAKPRRLVGVELDQADIVTCIGRGLDVIQADLNKGLTAFGTGEFECVILSQTLQTVQDVQGVIMEMLRIGQRGIVSIPNFGYEPLRRMLAEQGRAPKSGGVLRYEWYNTPNIRFFTIADFEDFCREKQIAIHRRIALDTEAGSEVCEEPNLKADLAIFVIGKGRMEPDNSGL